VQAIKGTSGSDTSSPWLPKRIPIHWAEVLSNSSPALDAFDSCCPCSGVNLAMATAHAGGSPATCVLAFEIARLPACPEPVGHGLWVPWLPVRSTISPWEAVALLLVRQVGARA
jgi:hypothetical protein